MSNAPKPTLLLRTLGFLVALSATLSFTIAAPRITEYGYGGIYALDAVAEGANVIILGVIIVAGIAIACGFRRAVGVALCAILFSVVLVALVSGISLSTGTNAVLRSAITILCLPLLNYPLDVFILAGFILMKIKG